MGTILRRVLINLNFCLIVSRLRTREEEETNELYETPKTDLIIPQSVCVSHCGSLDGRILLPIGNGGALTAVYESSR